MKAQFQGRSTRQQKVRCPNSDQADGDNVPVTPCTSGRAPDRTGRVKRWAPPKGRSRTGKICFLIRCEIFFFKQTHPTLFQLSTPQWLFSVFGPDKASQRKARRNHQSWFLKSWTLNCLPTSQVISRRYLLLHNVSLCVDVSSYELLNTAINRRNVWSLYVFFRQDQ